MRFIFAYTNQSSPRVDVVTDVTSITYSVISDIETLSVSGKMNGTTGTFLFRKPNGIPTILWD